MSIRQKAEVAYKDEIAALKKEDKQPKPPNWEMSPWAVLTYLMGGKLKSGKVISPKYIGNPKIMEIAIATLATDRALLLIGIPGTAKTWVSEHLAAAISGTSSLMVQGTAGTPEEALRYGWNYALLLSKGPSKEALVPSPVMRAITQGKICRIEELTRMPSEVQDSLITILSEKILPIPELQEELSAQKGFNVIATANTRDQGVNELSSALKRRFNTVILPLPGTLEEEARIVQSRVKSLGQALEIPADAPSLKEIQRLVTVFRELRSGKTEDGKTKIKSPSSTLSTAEAISVVTQGLSLSAHFGSGKLRAGDLAGSIMGAVIKDPVRDAVIFEEYLESIVRDRKGWKEFYKACKTQL